MLIRTLAPTLTRILTPIPSPTLSLTLTLIQIFTCFQAQQTVHVEEPDEEMPVDTFADVTKIMLLDPKLLSLFRFEIQVDGSIVSILFKSFFLPQC